MQRYAQTNAQTADWRITPIHPHLTCDYCRRPAVRRATVEVRPGRYVTAYVCDRCTVAEKEARS